MTQQTIAVIMDPLEGISPEVDTSFAFMLAAAERGARIVAVRAGDISIDSQVAGGVALRGTEVKVFDKPKHEVYFSVVGPLQLPAAECDAIFIRTDPPFDEAYLTLTWMLSFAEDRGVRIINSPRGLRNANEHLYSLYFPELCPETLISSSTAETEAFVDRVGGNAIAKPIDGHAGFGVVRLRQGDSNLRALCDMLSLEGRQPFMVQRFVEDETGGDRRLLVVDGELQGVVCRVPQAGDHRGNVHVGGSAMASDCTAADRHIVAAMRKRLQSDGLFFVGLDTIGDRLIEVNVTSPTLVRELKAMTGIDVASTVMDRVLGAALPMPKN